MSHPDQVLVLHTLSFPDRYVGRNVFFFSFFNNCSVLHCGLVCHSETQRSHSCFNEVMDQNTYNSDKFINHLRFQAL